MSDSDDGSDVAAWMPMWIGSYLADTMHLTRDLHGGYLLLLFAYWRNRGPLPDDDDDLAAIVRATPSEWRKVLRPKLAKFFRIDASGWHHKRADEELAEAQARREKAANKARAAAAARWGGDAGAEPRQPRKQSSRNARGNAPSTAQAQPEDMRDECPTPSPLPNTGKSTVTPPPTDGGAQPISGEWTDGDDPPPGIAPTVYGQIARSIRLAGIGRVNATDPTFRAMVDAGVTGQEFADAAPQCLQATDPWSYLLTVVRNRRTRAQAIGQQLQGTAPPAAAAPQETAYQRSARQKLAALCPEVAAAPPDQRQSVGLDRNVIDMGDADVVIGLPHRLA
ncbi:MAG: hypothetical protein RIQ53_3305 [Pseudomonadota bacterium]|jgi:uncharacterized protein YdaU (DUF1376 family)